MQFATALKAAAPETPTLIENNRAYPPLAARIMPPNAGVTCPHCTNLGDPVEMFIAGGDTQSHIDPRCHGSKAVCPRCWYDEYKRTG
jgi:hypothetical protein